MCAMHMLCKTVTVFFRLSDPRLIFDPVGVRKIQTHMSHFFLEDLALALNQVLSFFPIPFLTLLLWGGHMQIYSTYRSTIDPSKQGVVVIKSFVIRFKSIHPPPLCTLHHEPIVGVIYHIFSEIIVESILGICRPSDALVCQPEIYHIHLKDRYIEPLPPIFSTQFF